jgi:hypothetical protein
VHRIATQVDWQCEVTTLFRDHNIGCRRAVSSDITSFFESEPDGIILENDCLPGPSFFTLFTLFTLFALGNLFWYDGDRWHEDESIRKVESRPRRGPEIAMSGDEKLLLLPPQRSG